MYCFRKQKGKEKVIGPIRGCLSSVPFVEQSFHPCSIFSLNGSVKKEIDHITQLAAFGFKNLCIKTAAAGNGRKPFVLNVE